MSEDDLQSIADRLSERIKADRLAFWIAPEAHYKSHAEISELVADWRAAKNIFWKAFIGLAVIGGIVLATLGLSGWHK